MTAQKCLNTLPSLMRRWCSYRLNKDKPQLVRSGSVASRFCRCAMTTSKFQFKEELLAAVNQHRTKCPHWGTEKGCKKGSKCKLLHVGDKESEARVPYADRVVDPSTGAVALVVRPPVKEALKAFFETHSMPETINTGHSWTTSDDQRLITFDLVNMKKHDQGVCAEAKLSGRVPDYGRGCLVEAAAQRQMPELLVHGTDALRGTRILLHGQMLPSLRGAAGAGVNFFGMHGNFGDVGTLEQAWQVGLALGFNKGCILTAKSHGILVDKRGEQEVVPSGAVAYDGNEFAANVDTLEYKSITFLVDSLMSVVERELDAAGYSMALYQASLNLQKDLAAKTAKDKAFKVAQISKRDQVNQAASSSNSCKRMRASHRKAPTDQRYWWKHPDRNEHWYYDEVSKTMVYYGEWW